MSLRVVRLCGIKSGSETKNEPDVRRIAFRGTILSLSAFMLFLAAVNLVLSPFLPYGTRGDFRHLIESITGQKLDSFVFALFFIFAVAAGVAGCVYSVTGSKASGVVLHLFGGFAGVSAILVIFTGGGSLWRAVQMLHPFGLIFLVWLALEAFEIASMSGVGGTRNTRP